MYILRVKNMQSSVVPLYMVFKILFFNPEIFIVLYLTFPNSKNEADYHLNLRFFDSFDSRTHRKKYFRPNFQPRKLLKQHKVSDSGVIFPNSFEFIVFIENWRRIGATPAVFCAQCPNVS
jgi:hypothetical protein